jgi:hypothetical protein
MISPIIVSLAPHSATTSGVGECFTAVDAKKQVKSMRWSLSSSLARIRETFRAAWVREKRASHLDIWAAIKDHSITDRQ